jgi:hypothetical protein
MFREGNQHPSQNFSTFLGAEVGLILECSYNVASDEFFFLLVGVHFKLNPFVDFVRSIVIYSHVSALLNKFEPFECSGAKLVFTLVSLFLA